MCSAAAFREPGTALAVCRHHCPPPVTVQALLIRSTHTGPARDFILRSQPASARCCSPRRAYAFTESVRRQAEIRHRLRHFVPTLKEPHASFLLFFVLPSLARKLKGAWELAHWANHGCVSCVALAYQAAGPETMSSWASSLSTAHARLLICYPVQWTPPNIRLAITPRILTCHPK